MLSRPTAGPIPGTRGRGRLCSVAGSRTRRLLPPRAQRAAPTHPLFLPKSPQKMGPKAPKGRWDPWGGGLDPASEERNRQQPASKTRAPRFISSWFNRTLHQHPGASPNTSPWRGREEVQPPTVPCTATGAPAKITRWEPPQPAGPLHRPG